MAKEGRDNKMIAIREVTEDGEWKFLGWQNDWSWSNRDTLPFEYIRCCDAGHTRREENIGKHQWQVYCDICQITWKYDNSD